MLLLFDDLFYKKDIEEKLFSLEREEFEHYLNNDLRIIIYLYMLFLIEQDFNYPKLSQYEPKTLFLHGWLRQIICDTSRELDNYIMSVCSRQPPKVLYTKLDDKNHKEYDENRKELWYID